MITWVPVQGYKFNCTKKSETFVKILNRHKTEADPFLFVLFSIKWATVKEEPPLDFLHLAKVSRARGRTNTHPHTHAQTQTLCKMWVAASRSSVQLHVVQCKQWAGGIGLPNNYCHHHQHHHHRHRHSCRSLRCYSGVLLLALLGL